jgi:hypothetical protein
VARVSAKGCRVGHGVGGKGDESEGEKVAVAARGESGRRLREEASFPTKY